MSGYTVKAIIGHEKFDVLVEKALDGLVRFYPPSIRKNKTIHSNYAFLVYWKHFDDIKDRTWEPEEHFENKEKLRMYKKKHNLPEEEEKLEKHYGAQVWRQLQLKGEELDSNGNYRYLMTEEERQANPIVDTPIVDKGKKSAHFKRLAELNEEIRKKKEKPRERMKTPEDAEEEIKKKRKLEKKEKMLKEKEASSREDALPNGGTTSQTSEFRIPKKMKSGSAESSSSVGALTEIKKSVPARSSSSHPGFSQQDSLNSKKMIARPVALPGLQPLANNTPRIPKKTPENVCLTVSSPQCIEATASVSTPQPAVDTSVVTPESAPGVALGDLPATSTDGDKANNDVGEPIPHFDHTYASEEPPDKIKTRRVAIVDSSSEESDGLETDDPKNSTDSESSTESTKTMKPIEQSDRSKWPSDTSLAGTDSESIAFSDMESEQEEETMKEEATVDIEKLKKEFEELSTRKVQYPRKIAAKRVTRQFTPTLAQRKLRKAHSCEQLPSFWNTNTEIEIFEKNFESAHGMENNEIAVVKEFQEEPRWKMGQPKKITREQVYQKTSEALAQENWARIEKAMQKEKLNRNCAEWLRQLTGYFSRDDPVGFKTHFKRGIPTASRFDSLRFAAIVCMTSYCRHLLWEQDTCGRTLVESDDSQKLGAIRYQQAVCTESHRKCLWMEIFLKLLPARVRFLESSTRDLNGLPEDGPFRDDVFFHCMKNGAECQKDLFFKYNKPIGIQEEEVGEYSIDAMHMLSVQYGSIQYFRWYLSAGLDINAIATHLKTKKVLRLYDYMTEWVINNVNDDEEDMEQILYYDRAILSKFPSNPNETQKRCFLDRLLKMVRRSVDALKQFVVHKVDAMILDRMNGRWKIHFELTHPHILRCSPMNNVSNGGDGTHQVLSCVFHPLAVGYRDGVDQMEEETDEIQRLRVVHKKYQKMVRDEKGRVVLALFRVDIPFRQETSNQTYVVPEYKFVRSDEDFDIEKMTLLRQTPDLDAEEADLGMWELSHLSSPGCRYYGIQSKDIEQNLVVPGNAHIELTGEVSKPITFVAQLLFIKRNA